MNLTLVDSKSTSLWRLAIRILVMIGFLRETVFDGVMVGVKVGVRGDDGLVVAKTCLLCKVSDGVVGSQAVCDL